MLELGHHLWAAAIQPAAMSKVREGPMLLIAVWWLGHVHGMSDLYISVTWSRKYACRGVCVLHCTSHGLGSQ